jgi:hypothetical protein
VQDFALFHHSKSAVHVGCWGGGGIWSSGLWLQSAVFNSLDIWTKHFNVLCQQDVNSKITEMILDKSGVTGTSYEGKCMCAFHLFGLLVVTGYSLLHEYSKLMIHHFP